MQADSGYPWIIFKRPGPNLNDCEWSMETISLPEHFDISPLLSSYYYKLELASAYIVIKANKVPGSC